MREIDVRHLGRSRVICCYEVDGLLVDPGPESTVDTLLEALDGQQPRGLLLTHIHFDHAGAAGRLVQRWPDLPVWVHEAGARHLHDPERLVRSARQVFGEDFDRLWGEIVPVPQRNLRVLRGGETVEGFRVAYTPGHARHHVAYLHEATGGAYVGDVAGVKIGQGPVMPPTPPPDIDLEAWHASLAVVAGWEPARLHLTHFGTIEGAATHLAVFDEALHLWGELARHTDAAGYAEAVRRRAGRSPDGEAANQASGPETMWAGLRRYWDARAAT